MIRQALFSTSIVIAFTQQRTDHAIEHLALKIEDLFIICPAPRSTRLALVQRQKKTIFPDLGETEISMCPGCPTMKTEFGAP